MNLNGGKHGVRNSLLIFSIVGTVALAIFVASTFSLAALSSGCSVVTTPPSNQAAPVSGWEYLLIYSTNDGSINSLRVMTTCEWNSGLAQQGLTGSTDSVAISTKVLGLPNGYLVMDVTNNTYLPMIVANGYLNAFYVNLQNGLLTLKPGVSFSNNEQANYNGQPITNGTKLSP